MKDFNDLGVFSSSIAETKNISCEIPYKLTWRSGNIKVRIINKGTIGPMISSDDIKGLTKDAVGTYKSADIYMYSKNQNIGLVMNATVSGSSFEHPYKSNVVDTIKNNICAKYPNIPRSSIKSIEGNVVVIPRTISAKTEMNVFVKHTGKSFKVKATPGVPSDASAQMIWDNKNIRESESGFSLTTSWTAEGEKTLQPATKITVGGFMVDGDKIKYSMSGQIDLSNSKYCVDLGDTARFGIGSKSSKNMYAEKVSLSGSMTVNVDAYLMATKITYSTSSDKIHMVISPLGIVMKINEPGYTDHYFVPGLIDLGTSKNLENFVKNPYGNSVKSSTGPSSSKSSPTAVKMK